MHARLTILALLVSLPFAGAQETPDIGLSGAITRALAIQPGSAVEAEREGAVYDVAILAADGQLHELEIRATDGELVERELEDDDDTDEYTEVLRVARLGMGELIAVAGKLINGSKALEAELEMDDGQPVCEILLHTERQTFEVALEVRAGDVVEIEVENDDDDDDDD